MKSRSRSARVTRPSTPPESRSTDTLRPMLRLLEPALLLAGFTAYIYLCAFSYQVGFVRFYGLPAEVVRVSNEWLAYIGLLVALPAMFLLFFSPVRVAIGAFVVAAVMMATTSSGLWFVASVAVGFAAGAATILIAWRRRKATGRPSPFLDRLSDLIDTRAQSVAALLLLVAIYAGVGPLGSLVASWKSTYEVVEGAAEVVVYSSPDATVCARYSARDRRVYRSFIYRSASPPENGFRTLTVNTGPLASDFRFY